MAAGGLIGALAASSCCILPLVLFALGVSGAWIGAARQSGWKWGVNQDERASPGS